MRQVADNLRRQEYINGDNVEAIRKYIRVKNPGCSEVDLTVVFADALHKIIDTRIYQFEEKHRKKIKAAVLKKAVKKSEFSINASEVFSSCLALKLHDDSYIESFTQWINQNQPIPVPVEKVDKLITDIELLDEDYINNNLDDIVNEFEYSWAEDETLTVLGLETIETIEAQTYEEKHIELLDAEEAKWIETVKEFIEVQEPEADSSVADITTEPSIIEEVQADTTELELQFATQEVLSTNRRAFNRLINSIHKLAALAFSDMKYLKSSMRLVLPAAIPIVIITALVLSNLSGDNRVQALKYRGQGKYANITEDQVDRYLSLESRMLSKLEGAAGGKGLILLDGLHDEFKYELVDEGKLKQWLNKKNSILAEEPYFTAILETSKKYDIHPVLMFAIVGQEQGFVPKSGAAAKKIANNPFNVYGSWEKYNTNIYDSSRLAASIIIESSRNRPAYMNTIRWINRRYAEDPNWWNGVSMIFAQIKQEM